MAHLAPIGAPNFDSLPSLVLHRITLFCGRRTLRNLRLAFRAISEEATRSLFSLCCIGPSEESAERFNSICGDAELRRWVKIVCLRTWEVKHDRYSGEEDEISASSQKSFLSGVTLPGLIGVEIIFSDACAVEPENPLVDFYWGDPPQSIEFRYCVMELLLKFFESLPPGGRIRSLSIQGLQNRNEPDVTDTPSFKSLLSSLTSLELHIVTENVPSAPSQNILLPEVEQFGDELLPHWLEPSTASLTQLTLLGCDAELGFWPRIDLRSIEYPNLRKLALGFFTFAYDWQFEWIFKHAATLELLYLDSCSILYARCNDTPIDAEDHPGNSRFVVFERRWHQFFDRLTAGALPCLSDFRMGGYCYGRVEYVSSVPRTDVHHGFGLLERRLHDNMYVAFNCGNGSSQFSSALNTTEYFRGLPESERGRFAFPQCREEDEAAFGRLLGRLSLLKYSVPKGQDHLD